MKRKRLLKRARRALKKADKATLRAIIDEIALARLERKQQQ
jgi:hypothetical protein